MDPRDVDDDDEADISYEKFNLVNTSKCTQKGRE